METHVEPLKSFSRLLLIKLQGANQVTNSFISSLFYFKRLQKKIKYNFNILFSLTEIDVAKLVEIKNLSIHVEACHKQVMLMI